MTIPLFATLALALAQAPDVRVESLPFDLGLGLLTPDGPTASDVRVESLPFDLAALKARARVELKVTEQGKEVVYAGAPLRVVLDGALKDKGSMAELRSLSDAVLLVRAADGYQAAISAAAVAMDTKGERYLLALSRDGRPLGEGQGPVRLVVAGDPQRVRWVRMVSAIDLVRLPKAKPAVKAATPKSR
jgi:hypothetical protein